MTVAGGNSPTCRGCGCKLDISQRVRGLCDQPECRRKDVSYQAQKRRDWLMMTIRQRMPESWNGSLPIVLLPRNSRPLIPLPEARIAAYCRHLQSIVKDARAQHEKLGEQLAETSASSNGISNSDAELPVLSAACGLCGGDCCYTGGDTAWLEPATIQRLQWFKHNLDDDRIVDFYLSYLPKISYENCCVYQGEKGCTLPRYLRAAVCNQFLCKSLAELVAALGEPQASCVAAPVVGSSVHSISKMDALGILESAGDGAE